MTKTQHEPTLAECREAWALLRLVVAEWNTDPHSVQCFDLRIVEKAKRLVDDRALGGARQ